MVWDLRGALMKKQEVESARLDTFDFRLRVRTMRLLAPSLDLDERDLVGLVARLPESDALAAVAERVAIDPEELRRRYEVVRAQARRELIKEIGDPTPYRLA